MNQQKTIMFIKQHNSSIALIAIAIIGGLVSYGIVGYYYSVSDTVTPYTALVPIPGGYKYFHEVKLNTPNLNNPQNFSFNSGILAWDDYDSNSNMDIYLYDFTGLINKNKSSFRITNDPFRQTDPAVEGNKLVYVDYKYGHSELQYLDLNTLKDSALLSSSTSSVRLTNYASNKFQPSIYSNKVAWVDTLDSASHTNFGNKFNTYIMWDYLSPTSTPIRLSSLDRMGTSPQISNDHAIWKETNSIPSPGHNTNYDINYAFAGSKPNYVGPTINIESSVAVEHLELTGNYLVWSQAKAGTNDYDIYYRDLTGGVSTATSSVQIVASSASQRFPSVSRNFIVWEDNRNGNSDIYLYDMNTKKEYQITSDANGQHSPVVDAATGQGTIVWTDYRSGKAELYMTDLPANMNDTQPPTGPGSLTATPISDTQIELNWSPSSDNIGVVGYNIYKNEQWTWWTTKTSATIGNLSPNTTYNFKVDAVDEAKNISMRASAQATTLPKNVLDIEPPTVPVGVDASFDSGQVTLSWLRSKDNVKVDGYNIYRDGKWLWWLADNTCISLSDGKCLIPDKNVQPGQTYIYQVDAFDTAKPANVSSKSVKTSITIPSGSDTEKPTTPQNVSGYYMKWNNTLYLSWDASSDNVGVIGYSLFNNGKWTWWMNTDQYCNNNSGKCSIINRNPKVGATHSYQIQAVDAAKNPSDLSKPPVKIIVP